MNRHERAVSTKVGRGRNDRCPCGSGKKYKKCCLTKDERERREQAERDARWNTEIWYPKASDLQLPDIPENLRGEARSILDRALPHVFKRGIGIRGQRCWLISQGLTAVANGDLGYVEGIWTRPPENPLYGPDDKDDLVHAAHAWNSFRGCTVDLTAEFYNWNSSGEDSPWLHEPLKEYSLEELRQLDFFDEHIDARSDYGDISSCVLVPQESLPEHLKNEPDFHASGKFDGELFDKFMEEFNEYTQQVAFRPARERMLARLNATTAIAA